MAIRWITDEGIRDKYKDKKISILGTGPSLDDWPGSFFDSKILIGLNWAFLGFPKAFEDTNEDAYILAADGKTVEWVVAHRPDLLKRYIYPLPIIVPERVGYFGRCKEMPIYMAWNRDSGLDGASKEAFESSVKDLMEKGVCRGVTPRTGLGNAIFAAVVLGAKRIDLVGCDAVVRCHKDGRRHAQRGGIWDAYHAVHGEKLWNEYSAEEQEDRSRVYQIYRQGTRWLSELFHPYGIEIVYCFYPTAEGLAPKC